MNLRKLLCGLLALCLLLTMAPAALMEEAPVAEQVVELGEELEAGASTADALIVPENEDGTYTFDSNVSITVPFEEAGQTITLATYDGIYKIVSKGSTYIAKPELDGETVTVTIQRTGTTAISIESKAGAKYTANLTIVNVNTPSKLELYDSANGLVNDKTVTYDLSDKSFDVEAVAYNKLGDVVMPDLIWKISGDAKYSDDIAESEGSVFRTVLLKKEGKATITVTTNPGAVKATFKVKITNKYKPTKIELYQIEEDKEDKLVNDKTITINIGESVVVEGVVYHKDDYVDFPITWSTSNKKVASIVDDDYFVTITGEKAGTATITGKADPKSAKVTIKVINPEDPKKISFLFEEEEVEDKKVVAELYDLEATEDLSAPKKATYVVTAMVTNGEGDEVTDEAILKKLTWKSSDTKVATIKSNRDGTAKITVKDTGKTNISCKTTNGVSASFELEIVNSFEPIAMKLIDEFGDFIDETKVMEMEPKEYAYINAVLIAKNDMPGMGTVTYRSHHPSIATVTKTGEVYAKRKGHTKISVHCGDLCKKITIEIK